MCAAATPRPSAHSQARLGSVSAELLGVDRVGAELVELLARERHPGRLRDPAPVRVAAVERGLDQRRVGDRAGDPLGLVLGSPPRRPRSAPPCVAPSPSATISSASCSRIASSRPSGSGAPAAPVACSSTVSLVLIWPSTVIRSNEPLDGGAQRRLGVGDLGVGLHEAEHGREPGLHHPRPLRLGGDGHPARGHRARLRAAVGGHDRAAELAAAAARESAAAASPTPRTTSSTRSGTPITPVSATATVARLGAERRRGGVAHRQRVGVALLAGRRVRVAGVDDHGADRVAVALLAADPDRRRRGGVAGQQQRRAHLVRVAGRRSPTSVSPPPLSPQATPRGPEAGRQPGRVELLDALRRRRPTASGRSSPQALRLVEAEHQVEVLDRLPGGALPEVVDRGEDDRAVARRRRARGSGRGWCRARRAARAARRPPRRTARRRSAPRTAARGPRPARSARRSSSPAAPGRSAADAA